MRRLHQPRARLYASVRSAHLERAHESPTALVYLRRRYDFEESLTEGLEIVQRRMLSAAVLVARSRLEVLEINEPLMRSALPVTALALALIAAQPRARRPVVVTYAIENADPFQDGRTGLKARLKRARDRALARFVWSRVSRVAFGTPGSMACYSEALGSPRGAAVRLIPALPARRSPPPSPGEEGRVLYLGAFVPRKGFPLVVQAWAGVIRVRPEARIMVLGKGPLEEMARAFASAHSSAEVVIDPPRDRIRAELDRARVVVLPSQPHAAWREQVGLPIVEGLEAGCRIVTTDQTGLATWLRDRGHAVLDVPTDPAELADAIAAQLAAEASGAAADLPDRDGRVEADEWMFGGTGAS